MTCVYLGEAEGKDDKPGDVFKCQLHGLCKLTGGGAQYASCDTCKQSLFFSSDNFASKWRDPLRVYNRHMEESHALRGLLAGGAAFLLCGGPSANLLDLELLSMRGIWTMAVNNMAGHARHRPNSFVCGDPPSKFSHSIWLDPQIVKFIPTVKFSSKRSRSALRMKKDGKFIELEKTAPDCPNVWAFRRTDWLRPDDSFFLNEAACPGNYDAGVARTGERKTVCNMLLGIRLLRYLGATKIFLVGVDFHMDPRLGLHDNYSFGERRTVGNCATNNNQYEVVNDWLMRMETAGVFSRFGVSLYNCNELSELRAFPYVPFEEAVEYAVGCIEKTPDLEGWYEK